MTLTDPAAPDTLNAMLNGVAFTWREEESVTPVQSAGRP